MQIIFSGKKDRSNGRLPYYMTAIGIDKADLGSMAHSLPSVLPIKHSEKGHTANNNFIRLNYRPLDLLGPVSADLCTIIPRGTRAMSLTPGSSTPPPRTSL